jgi:preprotein translocase subunit SecY
MTYGPASLEQFNQSSTYALAIVLAGVLPVILRTRSMSYDSIVQHVPQSTADEQARYD